MTHTREIAFIDSSISDLDAFRAGLRSEIDAIVLDAASPALTQIAGALKGRAGLDAIHIVAHGQAGEVSFAAGALTLHNLRAYAPELREIGVALAGEGRLQLWTCQTAYGACGATFLAALERATGARVAASTTPIGAETGGGRWELDAFCGSSEVQPPLTPAAAASYAGLMAIKTWKGTSGGSTSTPKSGNWSKSSNWSPSGVPVAGDDVIIGGSGTYTLTLNVTATPNLKSVTISDSGAALAIGTSTLNVTGTSASFSAINVTAGQITIAGGKITDPGGLTLASGTSLSGSGTVAAPISGSGTVTASGGTLDLLGTVSGTTLAIATASASDLKIDGTATAAAVSITNANQTLELGATASLTLTGLQTVSLGKIALDGGTLTDASGITLGSGATLIGMGTVLATLSGGGTITANGGTLEFKNAVDGSAASAFQIANVLGSDLQFDSSVGGAAIRPTITFNGANDLLDLSQTTLSNFQGVIASFGAGDDIKVAGATNVTLDSTGTTLSVFDGSGSSLGTIALASSYTGDTFSVSNGTITVSLPSPPTLTVSNVISGPSDSNNATLNGYYAIPPDNALAVSTTDVLMAENDVIEITNRAGSVLLAPESLSTFFSTVDGGYSLTDPRAIVDPISGKFIVTSDALTVNSAGAVTGSAVVYAISNTTDPTGGWTFGRVNTTYSINNQSTWADQPTIASNGTDVDITSAQFGVSTGQYVANAVTIIPLSGGTATAYNLGNAADYRPAAVPGGDYFVGYTGNSLSILYNSNGSNTFTSSLVSLGSIDVGAGTYTAAQLGSSVLLDAGDNAVASTVYANGYLYAVFEVVPPGATLPAVHWVKVDASSNSVVAQGDIVGPAGAAAFNPSIAVDQNGDVLVNYTVSSPTMYPAAYASVMPSGTSSFLKPVLYGSSNAPETATFGVTNNVIRWGDYSSAVADPAAANGFVVSNEIVPSARTIFNNAPWATVTANITLSPGTSSAVVASSSTTTNSTSSPTPSTSISQPIPLTADASLENHRADALASTVAGLEAIDLPAFAPVLGRGFADIEDSAGTSGSRELGQDPHSLASLGLFLNYMASTFAGSSGGYGGTPPVDPAVATTAHALALSNPHV